MNCQRLPVFFQIFLITLICFARSQIAVAADKTEDPVAARASVISEQCKDLKSQAKARAKGKAACQAVATSFNSNDDEDDFEELSLDPTNLEDCYKKTKQCVGGRGDAVGICKLLNEAERADYLDGKAKDLKSDLKDSREEVKGLKEKINEEAQSAQDKLKEAMKEISDGQANSRNATRKLKSYLREQDAQLRAALNQNTLALKKKQAELSKLTGAGNSSINNKLFKATKDIRAKCEQEGLDYASGFLEDKKNKTHAGPRSTNQNALSNFNALIADASTTTQQNAKRKANARYLYCMKKARGEYQNELNERNTALQALQSDIDATRAEVKALQLQERDLRQDTILKIQNAVEEYQEALQQAQVQVTQAQQNMIQQSQLDQVKQQALIMELQKAEAAERQQNQEYSTANQELEYLTKFQRIVPEKTSDRLKDSLDKSTNDIAEAISEVEADGDLLTSDICQSALLDILTSPDGKVSEDTLKKIKDRATTRQ